MEVLLATTACGQMKATKGPVKMTCLAGQSIYFLCPEHHQPIPNL